MRAPTIATFALAVAGLAACSAQQLYGGGQGYQRNECLRLPDVQERERCLAAARTSYDDYQRQKDAGQAKP